MLQQIVFQCAKQHQGLNSHQSSLKNETIHVVKSIGLISFFQLSSIVV
jgi:hypothetical protein